MMASRRSFLAGASALFSLCGFRRPRPIQPTTGSVFAVTKSVAATDFAATPAFIAYLDVARDGLATALHLEVGERLPVTPGPQRWGVEFPGRSQDMMHPGLDIRVDWGWACVVLDKHPATITDMDVMHWHGYVRPNFAPGTRVHDADGHVYRVESRYAWNAVLVDEITGERRDTDTDVAWIWCTYSAMNEFAAAGRRHNEPVESPATAFLPATIW